MFTHNPDVFDVTFLDVEDVDVDTIDAPEDFDSAAIIFDPYVA